MDNTREAQIEFEETNALIQRQSAAVLSSQLSNESLELAKDGDLAGAIETAKKALALVPENAVGSLSSIPITEAFHQEFDQKRRVVKRVERAPSAYSSH